jgi:hypothetical protein
MVLFLVLFFSKSCLIFEKGAERPSKKKHPPVFFPGGWRWRAVAIADQAAASVTSIGMGECKVVNAIKSCSFE